MTKIFNFNKGITELIKGFCSLKYHGYECKDIDYLINEHYINTHHKIYGYMLYKKGNKRILFDNIANNVYLSYEVKSYKEINEVKK